MPARAATAPVSRPAGQHAAEAPGTPSPVAAAVGQVTTAMYSDPSERMVLAAAFDPSRAALVNRLLALLSADDFFIPQHVAMWSCLRTLVETGRSHDIAAVMDYANEQGIFLGGPEYVTRLLDDPLAAAATDGAFDEAALRIKQWSVKRRLRDVCANGMQLAGTGGATDEILSVIEDDIRNLRMLSQSSRTGPQHIFVSVGKVLDTLQRQMDGEHIQGVSTGYSDLDALIYGLTPGDLIILAARPSMGKTAASLNLADNIARAPVPALAGAEPPAPDTPVQTYKVLYFSTEMIDEALARRLVAKIARVGMHSLRSGELEGDDFSRITDAMEILRQGGIYVDDTPGISLSEIRARSRSFVAEHGPYVVIMVDYLQNLGNPEAEETRNHVSKISGGLKQLARELGVPVVALSQLSRQLEQRASKRPIMSDLRESGSIEQDADVIMFLYRDEVYNPDTKEPGVCEWIVAKQRDGAVGTVKMAFDKASGRFYALEAF